MKLEDFYIPISELLPAEQANFIIDFRNQRALSFVVEKKAKPFPKAKPEKRPGKKTDDKLISVTPEQLKELKRLGLIN